MENNISKNENQKAEAEKKPERRDFANDASYLLDYTDEGVFLHIDYEDAGGRPLDLEIVLYDLNRRNIEGLAVSDLNHRVRRREGRIQIAETGQEEQSVDGDALDFISRDEMTAELMLLPPCGQGKPITADELTAIIRDKWGITHGLDERAVGEAVSGRKYYRKIEIAHGKLPEKGEDGTITFLFNREHNYAPKIDEEGNADYKNLNIFESVSEGDKVVQATPPTEGVPGFTVKGKELPPKKGADAKLPKGKNLNVSEDGLSLIAAKSGRIDYKNGRVDINDVYKVSGDVDMSVGNIKFEGDVLVSGNVISGLTIEAAGMIEVWGNVEAATLIAGKDIILKKGMQGMDKGKLVSGGNVVAKFLERCVIETKGDICSDYIVQCKVIAEGGITMKGKWGKIIGGTLRAGKEITANTVGSPSNELTIIELGAAPQLRARYLKLTEERDSVRAQLEKVNSVAKVMEAHRKSTDPERREMWQKIIGTKEHLEQQYDDMVFELESIDRRLNSRTDTRLNVIKTIFPNVKIIIDSCSTVTRNSVEFATFYRREGEITFTSCEAR